MTTPDQNTSAVLRTSQSSWSSATTWKTNQMCTIWSITVICQVCPFWSFSFWIFATCQLPLFFSHLLFVVMSHKFFSPAFSPILTILDVFFVGCSCCSFLLTPLTDDVSRGLQGEALISEKDEKDKTNVFRCSGLPVTFLTTMLDLNLSNAHHNTVWPNFSCNDA